MEIKLPMQPFKIRERQVLNGVVRYLVIELDKQGAIHQRIEYEELNEETGGHQIWKVPCKLDPKFDNYGKSLPIITQWRKNLYLNGKFVRHLDDVIEEMTTNDPDMIDFGALLGIAIAFSMMNGETRAIEGYDTQPPFVRDEHGNMVYKGDYPEETLPDKGAYNRRTVEYIITEEEDETDL